jgi:hypothetical protein
MKNCKIESGCKIGGRGNAIPCLNKLIHNCCVDNRCPDRPPKMSSQPERPPNTTSEWTSTVCETGGFASIDHPSKRERHNWASKQRDLFRHHYLASSDPSNVSSTNIVVVRRDQVDPVMSTPGIRTYSFRLSDNCPVRHFRRIHRTEQ